MNYLKISNNSRSTSPSPYLPRSNQARPSTQDSNLINNALMGKILQNDQNLKHRAYGQSIREGSPPKTQKGFGRTFYPKGNSSLIHESDNNSFVYEDMINSSYYNMDKSRLERDSGEYKDASRENKFKTLNVHLDYSTIYNVDDKSKFSKMNTIIPGENSKSRDFKKRIQEQIKKNLRKNDSNKQAAQNSVSFQKLDNNNFKLKSKDPADQPMFPTIQIKKNSSKEESISSIENIYNPLPLKYTRDISNLRNDDARRTKSSQRHASVLRSRAPMDQSRRAISNQKASKESMTPVITNKDDQDLRTLKSKGTYEYIQPLNSSAAEIVKEPSSQPIISLNSGKPNKVYYPRPPSQERAMKRRNSKSLVRQNLNEPARERSNEHSNLIKEHLNNPIIIKTHMTTENNSTHTNLNTDSSVNPHLEDLKSIAHYRTQPLLEEQTLKQLQLQNNKSIDDGLRKTVDSQNEISYIDKNRLPLPEKGSEIQISNNFVVSPPVEIKRGRFARKIKDVLKREDSSKNILDELDEKAVNESSMEPEITIKKREASKSPFDELLETSIISYEKDSIARSRTRKEIEVTVSMTKNPLFKRSKVFVPKGYNGSVEKDVGQRASTNVTNSKSTYRNESIQSNLGRDEGSQDFTLKKSGAVEIDFGFEDDITLKKKTESDSKPQAHPTRKLLAELNVIDEENQGNQKETIVMSQDVISSQEFQRIVGPEPTENGSEVETNPHSPSAKGTTIKPMFFYCGQKLNKNTSTNKNSTTLSQKLVEDDICMHEENSDVEVVNSRIGLETSTDLLPQYTEEKNSEKNTIIVSRNKK